MPAVSVNDDHPTRLSVPELRGDASQVPEAEFISVHEFAVRIGVSKQSAYRAIERNEVPGVFKLGRRVTVNWTAFVAKTYEAA
jgi:predicted DNA-binding transcriptional regulator AlpA